MSGPRRRSQSNDGRILISESSSGVQHFSYPGDVGYDQHLINWNRNNNIPPENENSRDDVLPPVSNSSSQSRNNNNSNNDINPDVLTAQQMLLQQAREAYQEKTREGLKDKALSVLYTQKGQPDIKAPGVAVLQLTQEEEDDVLTRYISMPILSKESTVPVALHMAALKRLGKRIDNAEAREFQAWSDKFGDQKIDLDRLIDRDAKFTIDTTLKAQTNLPLSDYERENWFTIWDHQTLAKWISTIWSDKNATGTKILANQIREFDFKFNSPSMVLGDIEGEQRVFGEFNSIFHQHTLSSYRKSC